MIIFGFLIDFFVLDQLFAVGWFGLVVRVLFATCTSSIMHLICPPKFCITFVFHFSWVLQPFQEKLKTMLMQNFGGKKRPDYGIFKKGLLGKNVFDCFVDQLVQLSQLRVTFADLPACIECQVRRHLFRNFALEKFIFYLIEIRFQEYRA